MELGETHDRFGSDSPPSCAKPARTGLAIFDTPISTRQICLTASSQSSRSNESSGD